MKIGIRLKFFLVSLGLITLSVIAADIFLTRSIAPALVDRIRDDLFVRAALIERDASLAGTPLDDLARWDALADTLGARAGARVTIIRRDGTVIGDSDVEMDRLPGIENHAGRPEVIAALAGGRGSATRWSATLKERMMYVAVPFFIDEETAPAGVVRAALPLTDVRQVVKHFRTMVLAASLIALALAAIATSLASGWMSRSIRSLTGVARRMASGDLAARSESSGTDEIGELARAMNQLGESLSVTLSDLRSERDVQARILIGMREGLLLLDEKGRIVLVNPALREMLLLPSDVVGRPTLEVIRNAELHNLFERARTGGELESTEIEIRGLKPRRLLAHAEQLSGNAEGILCVFVDVTEIRRLETIRKDFVANVSHELRTPVASIRSAAETLHDAIVKDSSAVGPFLEIIERNAMRMGRLVDDLLDLSRIEAGEFRLNIEPLEVAPAADRILSMFRLQAKARGTVLQSRIPGDLMPIAADRRALEQILTNLVDNAIKYSGEEARVTLSAAEDGGRALIAVEDTGPGIDAQHLPRLFERFYRVDAGRSRDLGGTGLGLSIVRHLVEAMRGTIAVESVPGQGTTFRFSIPLAKP